MEVFASRPDVLDLIAKIEESEDIRLNEQESAFGKVSEQVVSYGNIPLGLASALEPYHSFGGSYTADNTVIFLAPALRESARFPVVHVDAYETALNQLLSEKLPFWTLICERDCDQEPRPRFVAESEEANHALRELFDFLRGVPGSACPTFIISKVEQAGSSNGG